MRRRRVKRRALLWAGLGRPYSVLEAESCCPQRYAVAAAPSCACGAGLLSVVLRHVSRAMLLLAVTTLSACEPDPIVWRDPTPLPAQLANAVLVFDARNRLTARAPVTIGAPMAGG